MDLISKVETVDFSRVLRGYDVEEVDAFHADLVREISALQQAAEAAGSAPAREAAPPRGPARDSKPQTAPKPAVGDSGLHDPDGAIQRLLAVAQRAADESLSDAKTEASRLLSDAQERSGKMNSAADTQRGLILREAAAEARRVAEATREPLVAEIAALEERRGELVGDLEVLGVHVADERQRLQGSMARLNEILDDPASFRVDTSSDSDDAPVVPISHDFDAKDESTPDSDRSEPADESDHPGEAAVESPEPVEAETSTLDADAEPNIDAGEGGETDGSTDADGSGKTETSGSGGSDDGSSASVTNLEAARSEVISPADAPLPTPEPVSSPYPDAPATSESLPWDDDESDASSGPPTEAVLIDDLLGEAEGEDEGDDRFLDELRRATEDDFGEDGSDAAIAAFFDQDDDEKPRKRRKR